MPHSEETKRKISETLKRKGIKPKVWFNPLGSKRSEKTKENIRKAHLKTFPPLFIKCITCSKNFRISPARKNTAKFCSIACHNKAMDKGNENRIKIKNINRENRRAREFNAIGFFTKGEWETLKAQYNFTCPACKEVEPKIKLTIDHIVPLSRGGSNNIENIQPLCKLCNIRKHTKIIKYNQL